MPNAPALLTPSEVVVVAQRDFGLKVTRKTVIRWAKTGKLPAKCSPLGRYYIDPADLAKLLSPAATAEGRAS